MRMRISLREGLDRQELSPVLFSGSKPLINLPGALNVWCNGLPDYICRFDPFCVENEVSDWKDSIFEIFN